MNSIGPEKFDELQRDVTDIKTALLGNERLGVDGMVKDVRDLKTWRRQLQLRIAFIAGAAATLWEGVKYAAEYLTGRHN